MQSRGAGTWLDRVLRPGAADPRDIRLDLLWLIGLGLLVIGAGLGLRDPWPADEPRFALIARDMLATGDWLIPRVGGDLYPDKPPLYFWLMAASMALTGSMRVGFLVPSLVAGIGTVLLVYDLLRRVCNREAALAAALLLLCTFQFVWQTRQAQIDATLCVFTTLSLYGLLRYALVDARLRWWLLGWAAAGLGVITKGVGFLPLLALLPCGWLAHRGWPVRLPRGVAAWIAGPCAFLAAIGVWFVPMWIATSAGGELLAYRNEILFHQTVTRYAGAWHHREPFWYYFVEVIPLLWLPAIALLPWAWPRWRVAARHHAPLPVILSIWVAIVVVFFSASAGKRGVYVNPAVPAFVAAVAPWLPELLRARGPRRIAFTLAVATTVLAAAGAVYFSFDARAAARLVADYGADARIPLAIVAVAGAIACLTFSLRDAWPAWFCTLAAVLMTVGFAVYPQIDSSRSTSGFVNDVERATSGIDELGWVGAKEQYLLQAKTATFNFGHARWRERDQEVADAAAWLAQKPGRALLIDRRFIAPCFVATSQRPIGEANGSEWTLVSGEPTAKCAAKGNAARAIRYAPP